MIISAELRTSIYDCVQGVLAECARDLDAHVPYPVLNGIQWLIVHRSAACVSAALREAHTVFAKSCADFAKAWNAHRPLALAQRLPPELVTLCFRNLPSRDLVLATHVSSHWRSIAMADPHLWSSFEATEGLTERGLMKLQAMLQRSQPLPFVLKTNDVFCSKKDLVSTIAPHIGRMKRYIGPVIFFREAIREDPPMLHLAGLVEDDESRNDQFSLPESWASGGAPILHTLILGLFTLPPRPCLFPSVRFLSGCVTALSSQQICQLFAYFPNLSTLELYGVAQTTSLPAHPFPHSLRQVSLHQRPGSWVTGASGLDYSTLLAPWIGVSLPSLELTDALSAAVPIEIFLTAYTSGPVEVSLTSAGLLLSGGDSDCAVRRPERTAIIARLLDELVPPLLARISVLVIGSEVLRRVVEKQFELPQLSRLTIHTDSDGHGVSDRLCKPASYRPSFSLRAPVLRSLAITVAAPAGYADRVCLEALVHRVLPKSRTWLIFDAAHLDKVSITGPAAVLDDADLNLDLSEIASSFDVTYSDSK